MYGHQTHYQKPRSSPARYWASRLTGKDETMENSAIICDVSSQLRHTLERIESLTRSKHDYLDKNPELAATYDALRIDEVENAQVLILTLTNMVMGGSPAAVQKPNSKQGKSTRVVTVKPKGGA